MPIYEFQCHECGNRFERLQKLSDADPTVCPACGKESIKRCLTAPAFRLAGSGWYETDFKKDGEKKHNLAGNNDAPAPTPTAGTDTAPSAPAASKAESAPAAAKASDSASSG